MPPVVIRLVDHGPALQLQVPLDLSSAALLVHLEKLERHPRQLIGQVLPLHFAHLIAGIFYGSGSRSAEAAVPGILAAMGKKQLPILARRSNPQRSVQGNEDLSWLQR